MYNDFIYTFYHVSMTINVKMKLENAFTVTLIIESSEEQNYTEKTFNMM